MRLAKKKLSIIGFFLTVLINNVFSASSTVTPGIGYTMVPYPKDLIIYAYMEGGTLLVGTSPTATPVATVTSSVSATNTVSPTSTNSATATASPTATVTGTVSPTPTDGEVTVIETQVVYSCKKIGFRDYLLGVVLQEVGPKHKYALNKVALQGLAWVA